MKKVMFVERKSGKSEKSGESWSPARGRVFTEDEAKAFTVDHLEAMLRESVAAMRSIGYDDKRIIKSVRCVRHGVGRNCVEWGLADFFKDVAGRVLASEGVGSI